MKTYTVTERSQVIYQTVVGVFDYNSSSDVVTPAALIESQIDSLPSLEGKILVPGAGIGSYVNALIQKGVKPENIHAVEICPSYYRLGSRMFGRLGVSYVLADYLTWNPEMQFDVIIGNPPFQEVVGKKRKDQASNLWTKFWLKSLDLTKNDGVVSLITPTSWMSPSANLRGTLKYDGKNRLWDIFDSFSSVAQVTGIDNFFKGVGSSFGVVTVDKSGDSGLSFKEGYDTSFGFLPKDGIEEVAEKTGGAHTLGNTFAVNQECKKGWRVSTPLTRKVEEKSVEILSNSEIPTSGTDNLKLYLYTHVESEEEAIKVRETILNAKDILNSHCRWSGFLNIKVFKMLNTDLKNEG